MIVIIGIFLIYNSNSNSSNSLMECTYDHFVTFDYPSYWNISSTQGINGTFIITFSGDMIRESMPLTFSNHGTLLNNQTFEEAVRTVYPSENWVPSTVQGNTSYIAKESGNGVTDIRLAFFVSGYFCQLYGECNDSDAVEFEKSMYIIANSTKLNTTREGLT